MGLPQSPMSALIVKPSLGLLPEETAQVFRMLCEVGCDFIKNDEKLMSPTLARLKARVDAIMTVIRDHTERSGKWVIYAFGISSADPDVMMRSYDHLVAQGGGWDLLTRHPGLGCDSTRSRQIWRLPGVDQFQINGIGVKYWQPGDSFVRSFADSGRSIFSPADRPLPLACSKQ